MEQRLKDLMKKGYNVTIQCKGKGRTYELTYEVSANKVMVPGMSVEEKLECYYIIEAFGNTLDEAITQIEKEIEKEINLKKEKIAE